MSGGELARKDLVKITAVLNIGTSLEWYDFVVSSTAAAIVWPEIYFSSSNPATALLLSFTVFGIGFLSRPIGSILFGHFGDKIGRKSSLVWTLLTMGIGTLGIGLDPSLSQIGILAPILLTLFRLLQGLGIGGEWGGAATMLTEFVSTKRFRGFWVSWIQQGLQFGVILGNVAFLLLERLPEPVFLSSGWRIAYYIGFVVAITAAVLRYKVYETPLFTKLLSKKEISKIPFVDMMKKDWKKVFIMAMIFLEASAGFYIAISFSQAYIKSFLHFNSSFATLAVMIGAIATVFGTMVAAYLSDVIGSRKKIMIISPIGVILFSFPFFILMNTRVPSLVILAVAAYYVIELFGWSVMPTFYAEYTPTKYRYTATSFAINLATPLSGGLAPIIMTFILQQFNDNYLIGWPYVALVSVIYGVLGLIGVLLVKEDTATRALE
ncbi:putative sialic acid transporter [Metallosphaera sp. J1]|uniref:MFS transporter n=1 Tax=Metallosphaera javensis (ex Hofmann et al. 2022) TaxID=99938 RepID=UPI001EE03B72|nr:MFS transporter [Metallosphaera javensis (ex Hofmann et al. 2022)]MCG3110146.1 putative sialic acid transporter [Metallosphaera javensis (ex Hofmann et al. 2022)]